MCFFLFFIWSGFAFAQESPDQRFIDSLRKIVESDAHDSLKVKALMDWDELIYVSDPKQDIRLNSEVITICTRHLKWGGSLRSMRFYAGYKANACNNLGLALMNYSDYGNSLRNLYESLKLSRAIHDNTKISNAYNNIALVYKAQKDFERALNYFDRSIALDSVGMESLGAYHNNVGLVYSDMENYQRAILHYDTAIAMSARAGDEWGIANAMTNYAFANLELGNADTVISQFNKLKDAYERIGDNFGLSFVYYMTGKSLLKKKDFSGAIEMCKTGLEIARESGFLEREQNNCNCLYQAYKGAGKIKEALIYFEQYNEVTDSIFVATNSKDLLMHETNMEFAEIRISDSLNFEAEQAVQREKHDAEIRQKHVQQRYLYIGLGLVLVIALLLLWGYFRKRKDNNVIAAQKEEVVRQSQIVEHKSREITDSINYAKTIQDALLPSESKLKRTLKNYFVLYLPKDIVAGDFYWVEESGGKLFVAVADCTGHGVPGAMVSVLCHNALSRSVKEFGLSDPAEILEQCRKLIAEHFSESGRKVNDGMDISLCVISGKTLKFAGANNNLLLVRNGKLTEFEADKQPVGLYQWASAFKSHTIEMLAQDWFYLFSDGYGDQFGGPKGKKYKYKLFKEFLVTNHSMQAPDQSRQLLKEFENWRGDLEQVDDICVMGFQV